MFRNFFWVGAEIKKKISLIAWKVQEPFAGGDLGTKDLGEWNQAAVIKNLWFLIAKPLYWPNGYVP